MCRDKSECWFFDKDRRSQQVRQKRVKTVTKYTNPGRRMCIYKSDFVSSRFAPLFAFDNQCSVELCVLIFHHDVNHDSVTITDYKFFDC